jgi:LPS sulfotransferase NodH
MSRPQLCYLVCATPRSGSTLLCHLLDDTGIAGHPQEYFEALQHSGVPRRPHEYFDRERHANIIERLAFREMPDRAPTPSPLWSPDTYDRYLAWALEQGTTPNGVFGAKVMYAHLEDLWPRLAGRALEDVLPDLRFVRVSRADRVAQAVSLWIAIQTQHWRDQGADRETREPVYSFTAIRHLVGQLTADELAWDEWLAGREVIDVPYERLAAAPRDTVTAVLERLGIEGAAPDDARMRRQAGARSREWIERYAQEAA